MMMANAGPAAISMRAGWRGPSENVVTACAAGTHAVANAARLVASGRCDVVHRRRRRGRVPPVAVAAFTNMTALSTSGDSRPFDVRRDGFVMTEGAGALVLESWDRAVARGAHIYAEIAGAGSTADAHDITAPAPDGSGAVGLHGAGPVRRPAQPADIAHINAHGTSTPLNDLAESRAINKVFGEPGPVVTSTKGVTGHGLGAAGRHRGGRLRADDRPPAAPADLRLEQLDPEIHLDVVQGEARPWEPGPVLSNSFGFGGHNGCLDPSCPPPEPELRNAQRQAPDVLGWCTYSSTRSGCCTTGRFHDFFCALQTMLSMAARSVGTVPCRRGQPRRWERPPIVTTTPATSPRAVDGRR